MIHIENMNYYDKNDREHAVLNQICLEVKKGDFHALVGEDDAGKTTLLHCIIGFCKHSTGICRLDTSHFRYLPDSIYLEQEMSVKQYLKFNQKYTKTYDQEIQDELIDIFQIDCELGMLDMTYEQNKIVTFIGAVSAMPELLFVDELANFLTKKVYHKAMLALRMLNQNGMTIFLTAEKQDDIKDYCDSFSYMKQGQIYLTQKIVSGEHANLARKKMITVTGLSSPLRQEKGFHFICNKAEKQLYLFEEEPNQMIQELGKVTFSDIEIDSLTWEEEYNQDYSRWDR